MRTIVLMAVVVGACGVNATPQPDPTPSLPDCTPNRDGVITADELPIAIGAQLGYYASPAGTTVDLAGTVAGGATKWDLSDERADDTIVDLGPTALKDQWYAASFATGQFVVPASGGLDGIYHQNDEGLFLDGTASTDPMPAAGKTLIHYDAPVAVLRFPMSDGDAFSTTAGMTGATIDGLPFIGTDTVDVDVTGSGRLDLPYVDFDPVLRVRTHVTRAPSAGAPSISTRTTIFVFECFGEIAHAESNANEPDADFTNAAVLRRFALGEQP